MNPTVLICKPEIEDEAKRLLGIGKFPDRQAQCERIIERLIRHLDDNGRTISLVLSRSLSSGTMTKLVGVQKLGRDARVIKASVVQVPEAQSWLDKIESALDDIDSEETSGGAE